MRVSALNSKFFFQWSRHFEMKSDAHNVLLKIEIKSETASDSYSDLYAWLKQWLTAICLNLFFFQCRLGVNVAGNGIDDFWMCATAAIISNTQCSLPIRCDDISIFNSLQNSVENAFQLFENRFQSIDTDNYINQVHVCAIWIAKFVRIDFQFGTLLVLHVLLLLLLILRYKFIFA